MLSYMLFVSHVNKKGLNNAKQTFNLTQFATLVDYVSVIMDLTVTKKT